MRVIHYIYVHISIVLVFVYGCKKPMEPEIIPEYNKLIMLRVDYMEPKFEAGTIIEFSTKQPLPDTLPFRYIEAGTWDFNHIWVVNDVTVDTVFSGSMVWAGSGQREKPLKLDTAILFDTIANSHNLPGSNTIAYLGPKSIEDMDFSVVWDEVSNLALVTEYMTLGAKVGVFLYRPSVGIGDPYEWDYYVLIYK